MSRQPLPLRAPRRGQNHQKRQGRSRRPSHLQAYPPGGKGQPHREPPLSRRHLLWGIALLILGHWAITGSYLLTPWLEMDLFLGALAFGAGAMLILRSTGKRFSFRLPRKSPPLR